MPITIYREDDVDYSVLAGKRVAIVGYGNQGHAHALNLRDSGHCEVVVGARDNSPSGDAARQAGFEVLPVAQAATSDIVMLLAPDEAQPAIYADHIRDAMKPGAALGFAHGFAVHYGLIEPRADIDVIMAAPLGPGKGLRAEYVAGRGLPALLAVAQDASGSARDLALAYAGGIGAGRAAILETTFKDETETDLFGEQAVLCGGMPALIVAAFETLVEAGYPPELAYIVCLHETKLITDLLQKGGIAAMNLAISNTAEFGGNAVGKRLVTPDTKAEMERVLAEVRDGRFTKEFIADARAGNPALRADRARQADHPIEAAGARVRGLMPWLKEE